MSDEKAEIKMLTLIEANAALPKVKIILKSLRDLRDRVLRIQAQIEIEEMTGLGADGRSQLDHRDQLGLGDANLPGVAALARRRLCRSRIAPPHSQGPCSPQGPLPGTGREGTAAFPGCAADDVVPRVAPVYVPDPCGWFIEVLVPRLRPHGWMHQRHSGWILSEGRDCGPCRRRLL